MPNQTNVLELECSACGKKYDSAVEQHLCTCGKPLYAKYDLKRAAQSLTLESLKSRLPTLWRYAEVLPSGPPVTLGEGMTPLLPARRLGGRLGVFNLLVKYEDLNPTGSFKARGMTAAVTRAKQLNAKALAAPTAGNAGGALAAYAAAAGLPAVIVMPADTPSANVMECQAFGAKVIKLNGLISDCGKYVAENKDREGWYDVSTLKEPYRVEGKKTMGYELWEQLGGKLPDAILYPTGGGVGLIGMCKAFDEMQDWLRAASHGRRAGGGLRTDRQSVGSATGNFGVFPKCCDSSFWTPRARTTRRLSHPAYAQADPRNGFDGDGRRDARSREGAGIARGNFRGSGRRSDRERDSQARCFWLDQAARDGRAVQHRHRLQVFGSVATRLAGLSFIRTERVHFL
jgi:hypothetical protein